MIHNVKHLFFSLLILAQAQTISAATYLPLSVQNFFRNNTVCVSPDLSFPAEVMVHNVKSSRQGDKGTLIINMSIVEAEPRTITTPEELTALIKSLTKSPDGKLFAIKRHYPSETTPVSLTSPINPSPADGLRLLIQDRHLLHTRALSAANLAEFNQHYSTAAGTHREDDIASNQSKSDVTLTELDQALEEETITS